MKRDHVESSNVESIGYDTSTRTLEIAFLNGAVYQYFDVPEAMYTEIMNPGISKGEYLSRNIKGSFRYSKV